MTTTIKQRAAMAAIVIAGLVLAVAVLAFDRKPVAATASAGAAVDDHAAITDIAFDADRIAVAGIAIATAGPATLDVVSRFPGEIRFDEDRLAHVVPRVGGVVERVDASLGQRVRAGDVLASLSSSTLSEQRSELLTARKRQALARTNHEREKTLWQERISAQQDYLQAESALQEADIAVRNARAKLAAVGASEGGGALNRFQIRAPFDGTVVEKHIALGEAVKEDAKVFTVADLASVWAEFTVSAQDLAKVRVGQKVRVSSSAFDGEVDGTVSYVGSLLGEQTRTAKARVTLANPDNAWRPGLFVTVSVAAGGRAATVAVPADAVHIVDAKQTVFVQTPRGFTARTVVAGRSDGKTIEILDGLQAGERVAAANAFVLKAERGKAAAEHAH